LAPLSPVLRTVPGAFGAHGLPGRSDGPAHATASRRDSPGSRFCTAPGPNAHLRWSHHAYPSTRPGATALDPPGDGKAAARAAGLQPRPPGLDRPPAPHDRELAPPAGHLALVRLRDD